MIYSFDRNDYIESFGFYSRESEWHVPIMAANTLSPAESLRLKLI